MMSDKELIDTTKIWRYISFEKLLDMLSSKALYIPTATAFSTDPNEGRVPEEYFQALKNWISLEEVKKYTNSDAEAKEHIEEVMSAHREAVSAARNVFYVSCWTLHEKLNMNMWKTFAGDQGGVAFESSIGNVLNSIEEYANENDLMVDHGKTAYRRETIHKEMCLENFLDATLPFYYLPSDFSMENEYRILVYSYEHLSNEFFHHWGKQVHPTLIDPKSTNYKRRIGGSNYHNAIHVPFDYATNVIKTVIRPNKNRLSWQNRIEKVLQRNGYSEDEKDSILSGFDWLT